MESPVERLLEFHSVRSFGSRERLLESQDDARGLYRSLTSDDVQRLVGIAIESVSGDDAELAGDIFRNLACLKPGSLTPFHRQLIDRHLYYPGVMYHGATADTANRILDGLFSTNPDDTSTLDDVLRALAWIGNETVQRAFDSWRCDPPGWADSLHIPVEAYAQVAGWELMPDGGRRDLFLRECHPLVKPDDENCLPGVLEIATRHEGSCPWCKHGMTTLLDLNLSRPELEFLHLDGDRLQIATCELCTCYGTVFVDHKSDGTARWSEHNVKPDYLPDDIGEVRRMPGGALAFGKVSCHWIEGAEWLSLGGSSSRVGGYPAWIQDPFYPECPKCGRRMMFAAQLNMEDIEDFGEGIFYMHLCGPCRMAATHYQQS